MNEETLFELARNTPAAERVALLERECAGRPELRARIDALLGADAAPDLLANATMDFAGTASFHDGSIATAHYPGKDQHAGTTIAGKYTLVESIGDGGMGSVWRAKQTEPVKRFVAVKLIKAGMDSKQVLTRFEAERQALAMMDHPNIAKVLDGGLHDNRPYFVMELVKGVPITEYCDLHKLTPKSRLELFVQACQAIQHAHQKGIIHRDIKPSNVLVALYDDRPVVKVIDFGVAKATGGTLTEQTLDTGFGGIVGTPQYMSPEQATFNNLDIDTRSDVYALGVLLYELLTGSPPFSKKDLEKKGLLEILRVVREEEPPRPSTKLSTADALPSLSANRGTEPKTLTGLLRNELDWIVMKALEKDRSRRYETANGFAADVLRYLGGEAVLAHPPSTVYRVKKFVRRHKGQVLAASLILFALIAGIAGTTLGLFEAKKQEQKALAAAEKEREAKREAEDEKGKAVQAAEAEKVAKLDADARRQEAERNLAFAKKGNAILGSVFAGLDPQARYATVGALRNALRDNLVRAVKDLDGSAIGDPLAVAEMQNTLGMSLLGLGEAKLAIEVLLKARATRVARLHPGHPDTLRVTNTLAGGYLTAGQPDKAVPLLERAVPLMKAEFGTDDHITLSGMNNLAEGYQETGKPDKALPLLEETLALTRARFGPDDPGTLLGMNNLATGYQESGRLNDAISLWAKTLERMKAKLDPDHPHTLRTLNNLAAGYFAAKRLDKAIPLWEELLEHAKFKLGIDHPDTLGAMHNLASGYFDAGLSAKSVTLFEQAYKLRKAKLGADDPETLASMAGLADAYFVVGEKDKSVALSEEQLPRLKATVGTDDAKTLAIMWKLAISYHTTGRPEKALPHFEEVYKLRKSKLGADDPETLNTMRDLGACYWALKRLDKSLPLFEELLSIHLKKSGRNAPDTQRTLANLGVNYKAVGRVKEAVPLLEEAYRSMGKIPWVATALLDAYAKAGMPVETAELLAELLAEPRKTLPKDSPDLAAQLAQYGLILLEIKAFAQAEPLLRECLAIREKAQPDAWSTFNTQSMLGGAHLGQKKYADAEPLLLKGYEGMKTREKTIPPVAAIRLSDSLDRLIELYTATDKPDEAKKYREFRTVYPKSPEPKK